jgi:osmotically-inducible protein OsmY
MTDRQIQENVLRELDREPQVEATEIGVAVTDGIVTLTGHINSLSEQHHAEEAAKRALGVRAVANDLELKRPKNGDRSDPDIARDVVDALEQHEDIPQERITIAVHEGWVTLEGRVPWCFQSEAAEAVVQNVPGVRGVRNLLTMQASPAVSPAAVKSRIEAALRRIAEVEARRISVAATQTTVILNGSVHSLFERHEIEAAVRQAPGVTAVENHLVVVP